MYVFLDSNEMPWFYVSIFPQYYSFFWETWNLCVYLGDDCYQFYKGLQNYELNIYSLRLRPPENFIDMAGHVNVTTKSFLKFSGKSRVVPQSIIQLDKKPS